MERAEKLNRNGIIVGPIVKKRKYEISNKKYVLVIGGFEGDKKLYDKLVKTPPNKCSVANSAFESGILSKAKTRLDSF